ncbi:hypothetical protein LCGC14_1614840 [marine sediment metagenome]|uniref:Uncharacterized protein n=1 Tax=marine sediment metagenome TaxID=412755 RepID=A0A0F9I7F6_9ZZZZ
MTEPTTFDEKLLGFVNQLATAWGAKIEDGTKAFEDLRRALEDNGLKLAEFLENGDEEEET